MNDYVVYEVLHHGRVVYIGSGKKGREKHPVSGRSSCVDLNRIHFTEPDTIEVVVLREGLTKAESLELEQEYIMVSMPIYNKQLSAENRKIKKFRKYTS